MFFKFCTFVILECLSCLPFATKIVCTITWRMVMPRYCLHLSQINIKMYFLLHFSNVLSRFNGICYITAD